MPSKIQLDENLWFLYICLRKSDMTSIDFNAVGLATSLKSPAARMRYTRLRRQIESGTLVGTHGQPFACPTSNSNFANTISVKRKRSFNSEIDGYGEEKSEDDYEEGMGIRVWDTKVKKEFDGDQNLGSASREDSEDDMPLAKVRSVKIGNHQQFGRLPTQSPTPHHHGLASLGARNTAPFSNHIGPSAQHMRSGVGRLPTATEAMQEMRSPDNPSRLQTWVPKYLPYEQMQNVNGQNISDSMFHGEHRYSPREDLSDYEREGGLSRNHHHEQEITGCLAAPEKAL